MGLGAIGNLTVMFGANFKGFDRAMKKAQRKVKKFGKSMKNVGSNLTTGLTMPIIGLGVIAVKTFADFEQAMLKVKAVSGATGKEFQMLEADAKRLGSSTMFTATQVAELQLNLSKLGLNPKQINNSTKSILQLAQATGHDLGESATIVAATMNSFGIEAKDSAVVVDLFALASSNAAMDMAKFSVAMPTVGATADAVGVGLQDLTAYMMTLADSGMEASTMGTHLRKIFVELATKGISFEDAMSQINTSTDKVTTATGLFGKRAFGAGIILAKNTEKTARYNDELSKATGTSKRLSDIMDSGSAGAMRRLASQAEGLAISLGEILIPVLEKLMGWLSKGMAAWTNFDKSTKIVIVTVGLFLAALGPAISLIGSLTIVFSGLIPILSSIGVAIMGITWPIAAVIASIVAIVVAFAYVRENWEAFKERLGDWNWIRNALIQVMQWFIEFNPLSMMLDGFNDILEFFGREKMPNPFQDISDSLEGLKVETKEYENEFGSFADAMKNQAGEVKDALLNMIPSFGGNPLGLGGGGSAGGESEKEDGGSGLVKLKVDTGGPISAIKSVSDEILSATHSTTMSMGEIWENFWNEWGEGIKEGVAIAMESMQAIGQLASSVSQKETITLNNEKAKQQEIQDADYERQLSRIENTILNEEAKQVAIEDLNNVFADKQQILDEKIDKKQKELNIKQAKRDKTLAIANATINGIAAVVKVSANIPLAIAVGALNAANIATMMSTPIPAFADGGIVSGPTVGLMGEYAGAGSGNPEVIAPLNKLKGMMGGGGSQRVEVYGTIKGNDLLLLSQKADFNRKRFV